MEVAPFESLGVLNLFGHKITIHKFYMRRSGEVSMKGRFMEQQQSQLTFQGDSTPPQLLAQVNQGPSLSPQQASTSGVKHVSQGQYRLRSSRRNLDSAAKDNEEGETEGKDTESEGQPVVNLGEETVTVAGEMSEAVDTLPESNSQDHEINFSMQEDSSVSKTQGDEDEKGMRLRSRRVKITRNTEVEEDIEVDTDHIENRRSLRKKIISQHQSKALGEAQKKKGSKLKSRSRVHTKKTGYSCSVCSRDFPSQGQLNRHKRGVHDKIHPFPCPNCSLTFRTREVLNNHVPIHSEPLVFICRLCPQKFPRIEMLNTHLLSEHFGGTFKCPVCFKNFSYKKNVLAHFKNFH